MALGKAIGGKSEDYNNIDNVASTDEEKSSWYAGYDEGYDTGYTLGLKKKDYNDTPGKPEGDVSSTKAYNSGYKYGYYEGYLLAVDFGKVPHMLTKTMTLIENVKKLADIHYPDYNISVVEDQDSYYTNPPQTGTKGSGASTTASVFSGGKAMNVVLLLLVVVILIETTVMIMQRKKVKKD
mgnify:CR=1 FL=1